MAKLGRPKGSPNISTAKVRAAVARIAENNADAIQGWLDDIKCPKQRLELFIKLLEYHIPKLARTELTGEDGGEIKIARIERTIRNPDS